MGSSFSRITKDFELKVVHDEDSQVLKNADEIMDAIKAARRKIKERLDILESISSPTRQDQYFFALQNKQKSELEQIFFAGKKGECEDNCIYPDVLQWYQPPKPKD